ncbi:MAG: type II toxin-antitoxin system RelE/ParE family toxin [Gemmatimonadetes bacterium]|nr:type II toxin-antitoxin system RelE/ParE family toxin [Gemmatimonadota bacterium]
MRVSVNAAARAELVEAVAFYNERTAGLGDAFAVEVRSTLLRILENPDAGFEIGSRIRRRLLLRFPFSILYNVDSTRLRVIAIMHHSREPTYWQDRI